MDTFEQLNFTCEYNEKIEIEIGNWKRKIERGNWNITKTNEIVKISFASYPKKVIISTVCFGCPSLWANNSLFENMWPIRKHL